MKVSDVFKIQVLQDRLKSCERGSQVEDSRPGGTVHVYKFSLDGAHPSSKFHAVSISWRRHADIHVIIVSLHGIGQSRFDVGPWETGNHGPPQTNEAHIPIIDTQSCL